ncbi:hypothetical protein BJY04DRAFT_216463 [Aspergillus karnatakaensis]|uniref:uncharacterized protein n=1 Tax=Aspergillus karnatakaensis TaxID=1810916 RepID=UPI003CCD0ACF
MSPPQKIIALAGGTGTIGSSILAALLQDPNKAYKPIILSRATQQQEAGTTPFSIPHVEAYSIPNIDIETRYVDYTSLPSLTTALQGVHTLLSTLLIPGPESVTYQLNLLTAAISAGVTRFAPSEFALNQEAHKLVEIDAGKILVWDAVLSAVKEGKIDAATFPVGMFMNYLAIGVPDKERQKEGLAGFREGAMMFHLDGNQGEAWVEVPVDETGEWPDVTMTDIRDVGRFVVAALGIEEAWGGRELGIAGDTRSLRDVVGVLRRVLRREIRVEEVSPGELKKRRDEYGEGDILAKMEIDYVAVCGRGGSVVEGVLNRLCPEVKATSIEEFVIKYWAS